MKKAAKVLLLVSITMLIAGGSLVIFAITRAEFDWNRLMMNETHETYDYTVVGMVHDVKIESNGADVRVLRSSTKTCTVRSKAASRECCTAETDDGVLTVTCAFDSSIPWYKRIWFQDNNELSVFLPEQGYENLTIHSGSGDVYVSDALSFASANIKTGSGDQEFFAPVTNSLTVTSSGGDITVKRNGCKTLTAVNGSGLVFCSDCKCGSVSVTTASGTVNISKCTLGNVQANTASGEIQFSQIRVSELLEASSSSGGIIYMYSTAENIRFTAKSGDVTGWMIEPMQYDVRSDSGDIVLPPSGGTHKCTIRTGSGNINLTEREYTLS